YAMLSHKWEDDDSEPLYEHISSALRFQREPRGMIKLRRFLRTARYSYYQWAWSDTCCIDKTSSSELHESITSMFSWYKNSAITIIYLSDVTASSPDALMLSVWFKRGWTLQEMLAPSVIRFYKQDWTPYNAAPMDNGKVVNDKEDETMLKLLGRVTGVDRDSLVKFAPGRANVRQKMAWASKRSTKRPEDIAYCLMGIFGVSIPVLYGRADRDLAFGRLLAEI
ncbi:hypothetical protein BV22DRAFT_997243, partial [Leucogyrophana mollusca]